MTTIKRDAELQLLTDIARNLQDEYEKKGSLRWKGSPFEWILHRPSRQRGKIGEQFIEQWCERHGLTVTKSPDSDADRIIEGIRVEIKFSTEWESGQYVFQQIRDQDYRILICLGISPSDAKIWVIEKKDIPFKQLNHQHGGSRGRDTWWFGFKPNHPPTWLDKNGSFIEANRILSNLKNNP